MQHQKSGWIRLGISLSVVWVIAVSSLAIYEWMQFPTSDYIVDRVYTATGRPFTMDQNQFSDLIPTMPKFRLDAFLAITFLPLTFLWLIFGLALWVSSGFKRGGL